VEDIIRQLDVTVVEIKASASRADAAAAAKQVAALGGGEARGGGGAGGRVQLAALRSAAPCFGSSGSALAICTRSRLSAGVALPLAAWHAASTHRGAVATQEPVDKRGHNLAQVRTPALAAARQPLQTAARRGLLRKTG
jgi:hypothetical protein